MRGSGDAKLEEALTIGVVLVSVEAEWTRTGDPGHTQIKHEG